jgi:NAD(P)-dependent dehydrogenase (short-subunit alcohol dehydrogenase family)
VASDAARNVAVITGGASGIGRALVDACHDDGMTVFSADAAHDADVSAPGRRPSVIERRVDVSRADEVDDFARFVLDRTDRVDLLVNNAGVMPVGTIAETCADDWARVVGVNLVGVVNVVRAFLPCLVAQERAARIVNVASLAGLAPPLDARCGAYAATKSAVIALSEVLAHEIEGTRVSVSIVCPSGVATSIFGAGSAPEGLMPPSEAARRILEGVGAGRRYVFTHTDETVRDRLMARFTRLTTDFSAARHDHERP